MVDGSVDVMAGLRGTPVFREVPDAILQRLVKAAHLVRLSRNESLFQRGQPCEGLHVLLQGQVKVYARVDKPQDGGPEKCHEKVIEVVTAPGRAAVQALGVQARVPEEGDLVHVVEGQPGVLEAPVDGALGKAAAPAAPASGVPLTASPARAAAWAKSKGRSFMSMVWHFGSKSHARNAEMRGRSRPLRRFLEGGGLE